MLSLGGELLGALHSPAERSVERSAQGLYRGWALRGALDAGFLSVEGSGELSTYHRSALRSTRRWIILAGGLRRALHLPAERSEEHSPLDFSYWKAPGSTPM